MNEETEIDPNTDTTGIYTFEAGKSYQIKISSTGSVESSYCKLVIDGNEYYTEQVSTTEPNNTISFTLAFDAPTEVEIITRLGDRLLINQVHNDIFLKGCGCVAHGL